MNARKQEEASEILAQYHEHLEQYQKLGQRAYNARWSEDELDRLHHAAWRVIEEHLRDLCPWARKGALVQAKDANEIICLTGQVFVHQLPRDLTLDAVSRVTGVEGTCVFDDGALVLPKQRTPAWYCLSGLAPLGADSPLARQYRQAVVEAILAGQLGAADYR